MEISNKKQAFATKSSKIDKKKYNLTIFNFNYWHSPHIHSSFAPLTRTHSLIFLQVFLFNKIFVDGLVQLLLVYLLKNLQLALSVACVWSHTYVCTYKHRTIFMWINSSACRFVYMAFVEVKLLQVELDITATQQHHIS